MDGPARSWRREQIQRLEDSRTVPEGDPRGPSVFVQMSPAAVLLLMAEHRMESIDAIISVPADQPWPDMLTLPGECAHPEARREYLTDAAATVRCGDCKAVVGIGIRPAG